jgi:nucleoside-diphosphate-sugar epimerase
LYSPPIITITGISSSNVILGAGQHIRKGDESWPYPAKPNNHYSETKALAEKAVLAANGKKGMLTGAVRPNGIFGPRDNVPHNPHSRLLSATVFACAYAPPPIRSHATRS